MSPKYDLNAFIRLCQTQEVPILITKQALADAKNDFNLWTKREILDFVACGGLENPVYINTKKVDLDLISLDSGSPARDSKSQGPDITDAYSFYSGYTYGYFSFFYSPKANRWVIKSFHINLEPDPKKLGD